MKSLANILKVLRVTRQNKTFSLFIFFIFQYSVGNPKLTDDQEQLLVNMLNRIRDTRDMNIRNAVRTARWINTEVNNFTCYEGDIFELVPMP